MIYLFTKQDKLTRMKFRQNNIKDVGLSCEADMGPANQIGRTKRRLEVSLASITTTCFRSVANQMKTASVKREAFNILFSYKRHIIKR